MALKRSLLIAAMALAACRTSQKPDTEELIRLEKELNAAFTLKDAAALERLMARDYTFHYIDTNMNAKLQATPNAPRGRWAAEMLKRVSNGPLEWFPVDARITGDTAIVVGRYKWTGAWDAQAFQYEGFITDTWVRQRGTWKILLSTATVNPRP
jgi:ketosteroid isomerase-like protein